MSNSYLIVPAETLVQLRALRLWHWRELLDNRAKANYFRKDGQEEITKLFDDAANVHLAAVQTLNDLFPMGETAESDAQREKELKP
jgi:hypothetical protein